MGRCGIVLSGGGARGAYQIGVWKALRALDIPLDIVTGTSVGAINGALIAQGDYALAEALWPMITAKEIMNFDPAEELSDRHNQTEITKIITEKAIREKCIDQTPLKCLLSRHLNLDLIYGSAVDFGLTAVTYPGFKSVHRFKDEIPREKMLDYIMASSACFPFFKPYTFDKTTYLDGGYSDYMPVQMAIDRGADRIIAVNLKAVGLRRPLLNPRVPVTTIEPTGDLGFILLFDADFARMNMRRGYLDTMRTFGRYDGNLYTFEKNTFSELEKEYQAILAACTGKFFPNDSETLVRTQLIRHLMRFLLQRTNKELLGKSALLPSADVAGKCLRLSPLNVYSAKTFSAALLSALKTIRPPEYHGLESLNGILQSVTDEAVLSRLFYDVLCLEYRKKRPNKRLALLASLAPAPLITALVAFSFQPSGFSD